MSFRDELLNESKDLTKEILAISSGTMATEFGVKDYDKIDKLQNDLVAFYQKNKAKGFKTWIDVVKAFKKGNITEAQDPNIAIIGDIVGANSYFSIRAPLKKAGFKVESYPRNSYKLTKKGKSYMVINKNNIEEGSADLIVGEIAIGKWD